MRRIPRSMIVGLASTSLVLLAGLVTTGSTSAAAVDGGHKFIVSCKPGQRLADDPIVHPGQPGASHLHQFFGSTATNAKSTVAQLEHGGTTCDTAVDTAAYWAPVVYRNGKPVTDLAMTAYYRNTAKNPADVQPFPEGLKMVAGNAMATAPQSTTIAAWSCRQPRGNKGTYFSVPPVCTTGRQLVLKLSFPDCWDGRHLDSADHKSHLAYSLKGVCPTGTPVNIPQLAMTVPLDVPVVPGRPNKDGTAGRFDKTITLSSGSVYTLHADFWNTWNQTSLRQLVQKCLVENKPCPDAKTG